MIEAALMFNPDATDSSYAWGGDWGPFDTPAGVNGSPFWDMLNGEL